MCRLVLETAIGPVLPLSDGKDREARWDSAAATGGVTQDPPCSRAARQGPATSDWRSAAEPNVQPGWLVKPLPRRGAWKGLRHRSQNEVCSSDLQAKQAVTRAIKLRAPKLIRQFVPILLLLSIFKAKFLLLHY